MIPEGLRIDQPKYPERHNVFPPYDVIDGWLWCFYPFCRIHPGDGKVERFPPLEKNVRTEYFFVPSLPNTLLFLPRQRWVLYGTDHSLWLLELPPSQGEGAAKAVGPGRASACRSILLKHCWRTSLLDVLQERELALADYRQVLKDSAVPNMWNTDQAALAIWTIRRLQAQRAKADRELRQHFTGRKPDMKNDWYGRLAAFLLDPTDTEAALIRDAQAADRSGAPWRQTATYCYLGVRRRLAGDKSGAWR